jgi:TctA family transporter
MSTYGVGLTEGGNLVTATDLSTKQFCAVKQTAVARTVALASTGGEAITGILCNTPVAGEAVEVRFDGFTKALAGTGGFTAGDSLQTEAATGKLITKTSTNVVVAVAIETCAAGEIGLVRVLPTAG